MKCDQCEKPGIVPYTRPNGERFMLCVQCAKDLQAVISSQAEITDHQFLKAAAMYNQALDDFDYVMPVAPTKGRIPVRELARAMSKEAKLTNIHVSHSSGVVLNTGDLAKIDAFVTATGGTEIEPIGQQIAALTEAIANTQDIADAERKDLIELVQGLSQEIVGERKQSVMKAMLMMIEERAKGAAAIVTLAKGLGISIATLFGP